MAVHLEPGFNGENHANIVFCPVGFLPRVIVYGLGK